MEGIKHLHMTAGVDGASYSSNSFLQEKIISITKPVLEEAMRDIFSTTKTPITNLHIADLGCSSGPNTLLVVSYILDTVYNECKQSKCASPEFLVFLNDLPGNDFNTIFRSLISTSNDFTNLAKLAPAKGDDYGKYCFIAGKPGSYYGRLFPERSMHLFLSSYSLHFLSQVPQGISSTNKDNMYLTKSSASSVVKAYSDQYQKDFSSFLKCRSKEMVYGGRIVFTLLGRRSDDPSSREAGYFLELLDVALNDMASKGMIEEEKLDSFNMPLYVPSPTEVKTIIEADGSFVVNRLEAFDVHWDQEFGMSDVIDKSRSSINHTNRMRAVMEPLLLGHFGEGLSMDEVFGRYKEIVEDAMSKDEKTEHINLVVSITRA